MAQFIFKSHYLKNTVAPVLPKKQFIYLVLIPTQEVLIT